MDTQIGKIDARMIYLKHKRPANGREELAQLTHTRRQCSIRRTSAQERLGTLNREERKRRSEDTNIQFIHAAMRILPQTTISRIWDELERAAAAGETSTAYQEETRRKNFGG